jgi:hypothetical protein
MFKRLQRLFLVSFLLLLGNGFVPVALDAALPPHADGRDCASAGQISLNSDVAATLFNTQDPAVYRMVLDQRGLLDIRIDPGAMDVWDMELLDSSCRPVAGVKAADSMVTREWSEITVPHEKMFSFETSMWTLPAGVFFVRITPNPVDVFQETFTFHTKFIPHYGHDCATAEPVKLSTSIDGELLYAEDREMFRLTTTEPGEIHAWIAAPLAPPNEPLIGLYSAGCSNSNQRQTGDGGNGTTTGELAPGIYYLSVEPSTPEHLGPFTLHVEFTRGSL